MCRFVLLAVSALLLHGCGDVPSNHSVPAGYLDYSGRDDLLSGGVKMVPVETSKGTFQVWTKRIGNHPTMRVLLLRAGGILLTA